MKYNVKAVIATLLLAAFVSCGNPDQGQTGTDTPEPPSGTEMPQEPLEPEDDSPVYLITNANVEAFLEEVAYSDRDYSYSSIRSYPGGGPGSSDYPEPVRLEWEVVKNADAITLQLSQKQDFSVLEREIQQKGTIRWAEIYNLIPGKKYFWRVLYQGEAVRSGAFRTSGMLRQLYFPSVRNVRDLGGWTTVDGKTVAFGKLARGGEPNNGTNATALFATAEGIAAFIETGFTAELDLRETSLGSSPLGEEFLYYCPGIEHGYYSMLSEYTSGIKAGFDFILSNLKAGRGTYFHCQAGRDRTGTLAFLLLGCLGVPEGDVSKEYELTYFAPASYSLVDGRYHHSRDTELSSIANWLWNNMQGSTFKEKTTYFLTHNASIPEADIEAFRTLMLE